MDSSIDRFLAICSNVECQERNTLDKISIGELRAQVKLLQADKKDLKSTALNFAKEIVALEDASRIASTHASQQVMQYQQALGTKAVMLEELEREKEHLRAQASTQTATRRTWAESIQNFFNFVSRKHRETQAPELNRGRSLDRREYESLISSNADLAKSLTEAAAAAEKKRRDELGELKKSLQTLQNMMDNVLTVEHLMKVQENIRIMIENSANAAFDNVDRRLSRLSAQEEQFFSTSEVAADQLSPRQLSPRKSSLAGTKRKAVVQDPEENDDLSVHKARSPHTNKRRSRYVLTRQDTEHDEAESSMLRLSSTDRYVGQKEPAPTEASTADRSQCRRPSPPKTVLDGGIGFQESEDDLYNDIWGTRASFHSQLSSSPARAESSDSFSRQRRVRPQNVIQTGSARQSQSANEDDSDFLPKSVEKRRRGRPLGSKNKALVAKEREPTPIQYVKATNPIRLRLSDLRDPEYKHPVLSEKVVTYTIEAVADWDRRKPTWEDFAETETRCLRAYSLNHGQSFGDGERRSACPDCKKARRYCIASVQGKQGVVQLMPVEAEVDDNVRRDTDAYWIRAERRMPGVVNSIIID